MAESRSTAETGEAVAAGRNRRWEDALPRPIGFVLGGGGSLGAAQIGMLEALSEIGVQADLVAGTSIGAINGAVVAADPRGAPHRLSHLWNRLDTKTVLPGGVLRRIRTLARTKTNIYDTPTISKMVEDEIGDVTIEQLAVPYLAMAVDADTTQLVRLTSGPVVTAILASSAIPGIFPAITRDGRDLYDGGLITNVPVLEALSMGARSLVVLDCQFPDRRLARPTNLAETILYAMTIQMRQQVLRDLPIAARSVPVLFLPGPAPLVLSPLDFGSSAPLIEAAYRSAREFLAHTEVDGPGLYRQGVGDDVA